MKKIILAIGFLGIFFSGNVFANTDSCEEIEYAIKDTILDLELIDNDIRHYKKQLDLPKEKRPITRCGSCAEEDIVNALKSKERYQKILEKQEKLFKENCSIAK